MWVQLLTVQQFEFAGVRRTYHPGDWVEVGKQRALAMIANKQARVLPALSRELFQGVGVVALGKVPVVRPGSAPLLPGLKVTLATEPTIAYERTCVWHDRVKMRAELLPVGFHLLGSWDVAVPLLDYNVIAAEVGDRAERERTAAVIRDLRVPVYDTGLLYLRRCEAAEALLEAWRQERTQPWERDYLGFLRALYQVKPLVLALPTSWTGKEQPQ